MLIPEVEHGLPDDMVEEIMARMEPAPLLKFKAVSKGLNNLITSKKFMKKQLFRMKELNRNVFILQPEFCFVPLFYDDVETRTEFNGRLISTDDKSAEVVASSNGLILFCNLVDGFFLMNPCTNQKHMLPVNKLEYPDGCSWAQVFFGMGYLPDIDDYKVVKISTFNSANHNTEVMIYSRNLGKWIKSDNFPHDYPVAQPGVLVHGRLHWRSAEHHKQGAVTSLNLVNGEYGSMDIPDTPLLYGVQQLVALDEETSALSFAVMYHGSMYTLWILRDYFDPESWFKLQINTSTILWSKTIINLQPLCIIKPEGSCILFRLDPMGLFGLYDMNKGEFTLIDSDVNLSGFCTIYGFVPSFHSPGPIECN